MIEPNVLQYLIEPLRQAVQTRLESLEKMAAGSGISASWLSKFSSGEIQNPTIKTLRRLEKYVHSILDARTLAMSRRRAAAGQWVFKAVKSGKLPRASTQKCMDCGAQAQCYDHRDYSKPHMVDPVCKRCDSKRGPGVPYEGVRYRTAPEVLAKYAGILKDRQAGMTFRALGTKYNISGARAQQLVKRELTRMKHKAKQT